MENTSATRIADANRTLILLCSIATLLGHLYLLQQLDTQWKSDPISQLSQTTKAWQHALVLFVFGLCQVLLARRIDYGGAGSLTRFIQTICILNACLIASLGYIFTLQSSTLHTIMLQVIASLAGIIMSGLIARRIQAKDPLGGTLVHAGFLLVWLALVPLFFYVEPTMTGAYQRGVGIVFLSWLCALGLMARRQ